MKALDNATAVVLLSGGQDSTTCLALACDNHNDVHTICMDYGQRHTIEQQQAKLIAKKAGVPFTVISCMALSQLTTNALTNNALPIEQKPNELPSTFVPGRNLIFLTYAAIYAVEHGIGNVYTGVCQTDFSGYPDCREDFIKSANQTINLAMDTAIQIKTPLMHLTKAETVQCMNSLGKLEWLKDSHTCYEGQRPACGECPACHLRLKGFEEAGLTDPLDYI